ncbi:MAG: SUMF1/EgtB/PvdO family nonheme iron enzyme, partial [Gammaproteobacteria bacterium]|nr:SUMF1/EgtB/PvdO family nonheme iron enzyme [Gammaproteobacteria bacterium]
AVLDNFIFIELEPGFESMVLIEPSGAEADQENDALNSRDEAKDFWIDQELVSAAEFATFLESTGYESQPVTLNDLEFINQNDGLAVVAGTEDWQPQAGIANWNEPSTSDNAPINPDLPDQQKLELSFKDALAYCNWLGKELPSQEQFNYLVEVDRGTQTLHPDASLHYQWQVKELKTALVAYNSLTHDQAAYTLAEFRCVKNI